jgi:hypothetical protein
MLDELGAAICSHFGEALPAGTTVSLEPPSPGWADPSTGAVSLFLYQVLEKTDGGSAGLWTEDRDADGRVAGRRSPERCYDFCYLVTAWSASLERELALLGEILRSVAHAPLVPAEQLVGSMAHARGPLTLAIGRGGFPPAQSSIWAALGLPPRTHLDLVVTAPVSSALQTDLARPPETIDLGMAAPTKPVTAQPAGTRTGGDKRRPTARITEGARDGQARREVG